MKLNYKYRIFLYFFVVFALFSVGILLFEQQREKKYKTEMIESDQRIYTELIHEYLEKNDVNIHHPDSLQPLLSLLPSNLRVTIIEQSGHVVFDNDVKKTETLDSHKDRPEVKKALLKGSGSDIRKSTSTNKEFLYFAQYYDSYFIRVAMPYDVDVKNFFKSDHIFLYFIIFLFFIALLALVYISNRFGKSIARLKDFVVSAQEGQSGLETITFPEDELGEIGNKIMELYKELQDNKKKVDMEREKLLQHFQASQEGVCFFTAERKKLYSNSHFIQYLNILTDKPTLSLNAVFEDPVFIDLQAFLNKKKSSSSVVFETQISKNRKHFSIKAIRFDDKSFEIIIDDITKMEKTRLLKQEMTNNIAHELRTPVTSIRGYLETLKEQPDLDTEKRQLFVDRAFSQIMRLSELIQDVSIITRMEEASDMFEIETVKIRPLLNELKTDLSNKLNEHHIDFVIEVPDDVQIEGNRTLIYSIFRNLADNSIAYGGDNIEIHVHNYMEDDTCYYFSCYDTGVGVEERHLSRLFERFYRVNEGRTRNTGGSGLGLSIVKNAILFHKGEIVAKNRKEGGLEFLFTLKKNR